MVPNTRLFFSSQQNANKVFLVDSVASTNVAYMGDGASAYLDAQLALQGKIYNPTDVRISTDGKYVYVLDALNRRIRRATIDACPLCEAGKYSVGDGVGCLVCPDRYTSEAGATACTACAMEQYVASPGICLQSPCVRGQFYDRVEKVCVDCPLGKTSIMGSATSAADCFDGVGCPTNQYYDMPYNLCKQCPSGYSRNGSTSVCDCKTPCAADSYWNAAAGVCQACEAGKTSPAYASSYSGVCDLPSRCSANTYGLGNVTTITNVRLLAGSGTAGLLDGAATSARFNAPEGLDVGNDYVYVQDRGNGRIRKVSLKDGYTTTIATITGNEASIRVCPDETCIYYASRGTHTLVKISLLSASYGTVTTVAGTTTAAYTNGVGTNARFNQLMDAAFGNQNQKLFLADVGNNVIRTVQLSTMTVTTFSSLSGVTAVDVSPDDKYLAGIAYSNGLYISGTLQDGTTMQYLTGGAGCKDGTFADARFYDNFGVRFSPSGSQLFVLSRSCPGIKLVDLVSRTVTTLGLSSGGYVNDVLGRAAAFNNPRYGAFTKDGTQYVVADGNNHRIRIMQVDACVYCPDGQVSAAGSSAKCYCTANPCSDNEYWSSVSASCVRCPSNTQCAAGRGRSLADCLPVSLCPINRYKVPMFPTSTTTMYTASYLIYGLVRASNGVFYITNAATTLFSYNPTTNTATNIFTSGTNLYNLMLSADETVLYVADTGGMCIRQFALTATPITASVYAGTCGTSGTLASPVALASTKFNRPTDMLRTPDNAAFIVADANNQAIRRIELSTSIVTTIITTACTCQGITFDPTYTFLYYSCIDAGCGVYKTNSLFAGATKTLIAGGTCGDVDGIGTQAQLNLPFGIRYSTVNDVLIVSDYNNKKFKIISLSDYSVYTLSSVTTISAYLVSNDTESKIYYGSNTLLVMASISGCVSCPSTYEPNTLQMPALSSVTISPIATTLALGGGAVGFVYYLVYAGVGTQTTYTVTFTKAAKIDVLIVAGGGGGGNALAAGGGAGCVIYAMDVIVPTGTYPALVGDGGAGGTGGYGTNGYATSFFGATANGGGAGAGAGDSVWDTTARAGNAGGSGGGGRGVSSGTAGVGGAATYGSITSGSIIANANFQVYANAGGKGGVQSSSRVSSGAGGGAGSPGIDGSSSTGANGGDGVQINIDGNNYFWGGGGGGTTYYMTRGGDGGKGGGGAGALGLATTGYVCPQAGVGGINTGTVAYCSTADAASNQAGGDGGAGTGGGGGGGPWNTGNGGKGGSGIIIIRVKEAGSHLAQVAPAGSASVNFCHPPTNDVGDYYAGPKWDDYATCPAGNTTMQGFASEAGSCVKAGVCPIGWYGGNAVTRMWDVDTLSGDGWAGLRDGSGEYARFNTPYNLMCGETFVLVADGGNNAIRKVDLESGYTYTLAGQTTAGTTNGIGTAAQFRNPMDVTLTKDELVAYVVDNGNNCIRKIDLLTATVTTYAGVCTNTATTSVIGTTTTDTRFNLPRGLALSDDDAWLIVVDTNHMRKILVATGAVTAVVAVPSGSPTMIPGGLDLVGSK
eukprot:335510-Hanusia_phi.AAC.1